MKIFQIGFNRCGTKTIHHYLRANGVKSVHWDHGRLARRIFKNLANGDSLLSGYEHFDAFHDMEFISSSGSCLLEAFKLFPYFAAQYPDAVFILNTRDREAWIRSRLNHNDNYAERQRRCLGAASEAELVDIWRTDWEQHHCRVTQFFADRPTRFFVCKIETDLPDRLNAMLPELRLDKTRYTLQHATQYRSRIGAMNLLRRFATRAPENLKRRTGGLRD